MLKPSLKLLSSKNVTWSVTWAMKRVLETEGLPKFVSWKIQNTNPRALIKQIWKHESLSLVSADCALALSQAEEVVASGDSESPDAGIEHCY